MIRIIAIIINIIMIAIVTVNVVITVIIIMKTCLFFIIAVFINVIINDVIVFGFVFFFKSISLSGSDSDISFFHVWKMYFLFDLLCFCQSSSCTWRRSHRLTDKTNQQIGFRVIIRMYIKIPTDLP